MSLERVAGVLVEIGALQRSLHGIGRGSAALLDATLAAASRPTAGIGGRVAPSALRQRRKAGRLE
ncbi:MAG TPA: hypothetical protein VET87_12760 [Rubrivivax sp.]|nr:hypothetical protein [Rubrivivax sp.]